MILLWQFWFEVFKEMPAQKLTEAHCYSRHSCSQLLPIGVIFIWFSDKMLFTLIAVKNLVSGIWCSAE